MPQPESSQPTEAVTQQEAPALPPVTPMRARRMITATPPAAVTRAAEQMGLFAAAERATSLPLPRRARSPEKAEAGTRASPRKQTSEEAKAVSLPILMYICLAEHNHA